MQPHPPSRMSFSPTALLRGGNLKILPLCKSTELAKLLLQLTAKKSTSPAPQKIEAIIDGIFHELQRRDVRLGLANAEQAIQ